MEAVTFFTDGADENVESNYHTLQRMAAFTIDVLYACIFYLENM
jgi:hypothetical protein